MPLTNPNKVVTEERLSEFYGQILPYMGGMPDVLANKFSKGDLYSTDEKMIGCWVDNRPLYQKTVATGGNVPSGATLIQRTTQTGYDTILYTKTTDSPIAIGSDTDYSTTEKIVGTWIDGRSVWQKSYNATILGSQSSLTVDSIPANLDKLIAITGSVVDVTNSIKTTLPFMNNTNYFCRVQMLNGDIKVLSAGNGDSFEVNFTIQYTKTS